MINKNPTGLELEVGELVIVKYRIMKSASSPYNGEIMELVGYVQKKDSSEEENILHLTPFNPKIASQFPSTDYSQRDTLLNKSRIEEIIKIKRD